MSLIITEEKYLDNLLEAIINLETGNVIYFVNSKQVDLDEISQTNIPIYIILSTLGMQLRFEKEMRDEAK